MNKGVDLKDSFYYSDLIYEIKNLAGFDIDADVDSKFWERVTKRRSDIACDDVQSTGLTKVYGLSPYTEELFGIIKEIAKRANIQINSLTDISKYPLIVLDVLVLLKKKELENYWLINLVELVEQLGIKHAFSLGEDSEQCVCLNKKDTVWEVYIVERGQTFEKDIFEDCFDACLQVIHHLADSKQTYEQAKEEFVLKRTKLINREQKTN